ncbi:MAG: VOC family protein [Acidobacteria bacterium]|nr:VOC family protein [Acidobacteriota bacterium]
MSDTCKNSIGQIAWRDLTVPDAAAVRDFYSGVVGWRAEPVDMGGYSDFNMLPPASSEPVAGICYARAGNANLPAQWLIYVTVADLDESMHHCVKLGGRVIDGPRKAGKQRYCVIQDPAGAVCALVS